jgi:RNA polymerase sigma-70 factor (ECF subfamily)
MTGSEQDAEDITQETFIKVIKSLPGFEGRSQLTTWIYRIAMNESLMNLRRRKPAGSTVEIDAEKDEEEGAEIEIVDWASQPEAELLNSEGKQQLDLAIARLPESMRSVFTLRDLQGLSIEETASVLGISIANVKTRLLRARLKLRQDLSLYHRERLGRSD